VGLDGTKFATMTQSLRIYSDSAPYTYHIIFMGGLCCLQQMMNNKGPDIRMLTQQGTINNKQFYLPTHMLAIITPKYYISHQSLQ